MNLKRKKRRRRARSGVYVQFVTDIPHEQFKETMLGPFRTVYTDFSDDELQLVVDDGIPIALWTGYGWRIFGDEEFVEARFSREHAK